MSDGDRVAVADETTCCSICLMASNDQAGQESEPLHSYCECACRWRHPSCLQRWLRTRESIRDTTVESMQLHPLPFARDRYGRRFGRALFQSILHLHSHNMVELTLLDWLCRVQLSDNTDVAFDRSEEHDIDVLLTEFLEQRTIRHLDARPLKCDTCRAEFSSLNKSSLSTATAPPTAVPPPSLPSIRSVVLYILVTTLFTASNLLLALFWYAMVVAILDDRGSFFVFVLSCRAASFPSSHAMNDSNHRWCAALLRALGVDFDSPRRNPNHVRDLQVPLASSASWKWRANSPSRLFASFWLPPSYVFFLFLPSSRTAAPTTMYWHRYARRYLLAQRIVVAEAALADRREEEEDDDDEDDAFGEPEFCLWAFQKYVAQYVLILLATQVVEISLGSDTRDLVGWLITIYVVGCVFFSIAQRALYNWIRLRVVPVRYPAPTLEHQQRVIVPRE